MNVTSLRLTVAFMLMCMSVFLVPPAAAADATGTSFLAFTSDPDDWVGQGESRTLTNADGVLWFGMFDASTFVATFDGYDGTSKADLHLRAPSGQPLVAGAYANATRFQSGDPSLSQLAFDYKHRGCNVITGRFDVLEATYGPDNYIQTFHATFEQHCEGSTAAVYGEVQVFNPPPPVSFAPSEIYRVGSWPASVGIADVTGDGRQDVLLTTSSDLDPTNDFKLFLFPQAPDGSLGPPSTYSTHAQRFGLMGLATGDVDGDGRDDVAVATDSGIDVFVQHRMGLRRPNLVATSSQAFGVEIADMNLDGSQDIITNTRDGVILLTQKKKGYATSLVTPEPQYEIEVADLTHDGLPDVAGCSGLNGCTAVVNVFEQGASSSFSVHQYPATVGGCPGASGIGVGDVTGDGLDDVTLSICGNTPDAYVNVLPQTVNGLGTPTAYASYDIPRPVAVADMNGDNLGDVVTMHSSWMRAGVYLQDAGTLGTESLYPTWHGEYNSEGLAIGDINGDAKPDIVAANYPYGLEVLRQQ